MRTRFVKRNFLKGFTLIELMVSIGIMAILTTILFSNYPDSMTRIGLTNTVHKVALLVREAQVRGSAIDSVVNLQTVAGYGLYASKASPTQLILFSDFANGAVVNGITLGDGLYTLANEKVSTLNLLQNFKISNMCVTTNGIKSCVASSTSNVLKELTVSFTRPSPRPNIYMTNNSGVITSGYDEACIEIKSPKAPLLGHTRSVKVNNTGFITTIIGYCN